MPNIYVDKVGFTGGLKMPLQIGTEGALKAAPTTKWPRILGILGCLWLS